MNEENLLFKALSWIFSIIVPLLGIYLIFGSIKYIDNILIGLLYIILLVPLFPSLSFIIRGERIFGKDKKYSMWVSLVIVYLYQLSDFIINIIFVFLILFSVFIELFTILISVFSLLGLFALTIWIVKYIFNWSDFSAGIMRDDLSFIMIFTSVSIGLMILSYGVIKKLKKKYDNDIIEINRMLYQKINSKIKNWLNLS
jgi:hypothetical protein